MLLFEPERLWSRQEVIGNPSLVPRQPGVYAWYFREIPTHLALRRHISKRTA